jgi:oligopeptide transport system substrate-binding protein
VFRAGAGEPETLDPGLVTTVHAVALARELFESLVAIDGELNVVPAAARRWSVSDGGRRYSFELRPELRWSDGKPLTAHDFVFAWRRNLLPETGAGLASQLYPLAGAEALHQGLADDVERLGVRAAGDHQLEVELTAPVGHFLYVLASPIAFPQPAHALQRRAEGAGDAQSWVSNGPFMLAGWSRGRHLDLTRNPYARRAAGDLRDVRIIFGTPEDDFARQGSLDLLRCEDRPDQLEGHPGVTVSVQYLNTFLLGFACAHAPFDRPAMRRAFAQAVNRELLVEQVWKGLQQPARGGVVPPGMPGHSPEISPPFDPAAARAALAAAGGCSAPISLAALPGLGATPEFLRDAWRAHLGVDVAVHKDVGVEELLEGVANGRFQLAIFGWDLDFPEPADILRTLFYGASPVNYFGWRNARFDALIDAAVALSASDERLALFHSADKLLVAEEVAALPLYHTRSYALLQPGYSLAGGARLVRGGRLGFDQIVRLG